MIFLERIRADAIGTVYEGSERTANTGVGVAMATGDGAAVADGYWTRARGLAHCGARVRCWRRGATTAAATCRNQEH